METGDLNQDQLTDLYAVAQEATTRRKAIAEGEYKPVGEQVTAQLQEIETTWEKIRKYIR